MSFLSQQCLRLCTQITNRSRWRRPMMLYNETQTWRWQSIIGRRSLWRHWRQRKSTDWRDTGKSRYFEYRVQITVWLWNYCACCVSHSFIHGRSKFMSPLLKKLLIYANNVEVIRESICKEEMSTVFKTWRLNCQRARKSSEKIFFSIANEQTIVSYKQVT